MTIDRLKADVALFVVNHSGGKDSQAMMIEVLRLIPAKQIVVVHASLGKMEWAGALELAQEQAANANVPFIIAKSQKTFLEMVSRRFESRPELPSWRKKVPLKHQQNLRLKA